MNAEVDLAIVGSGFGGSLLAMIGRRHGLSVALLERGRHPRFAIGESSTPLTNLLLEELAREYELPAVGALAKWGTWQATHPAVACGLKRGFTFYHHELGRVWEEDPDRRSQLLVAASPRDAIADTHWFRADFDQCLTRIAQDLGANLIDELHLSAARFDSRGAELSGVRRGQALSLRARLVVDASGPRGFLHQALGLQEATFDGFPETEALFSHFEQVRRWDSLHPSAETPPYPVDDAAVHHVFPGGWIWVLRFNNGITSAGVATERRLAASLSFGDGPEGWRRLLERLPSVQEQFARASAVRPFTRLARLSFRSLTAAGADGSWAMLPSAAGFIDPLLSTGFPLTLLGIARLGRLLRCPLGSPELARGLEDYSAQTLAELDVTAKLVAALYANLEDFEMFRLLTFLYFAASMYAETMRRLGRPERGGSFLLHEDPRFGPALRRCVREAMRRPKGTERARLLEAIRTAVEPFNLAALGDPARRHWYPARAADLLAAAGKLEASPAELEQLLARCGFSSR